MRKFNNSLISNRFVEQIKQLIENIKQRQLWESEQTDQVKWEILKYETRKFESLIPRKSRKTLEGVNVNYKKNQKNLNLT